MREGGLMFDDNQEHSPDQIVFQIDNKGYSQQDSVKQNEGEANYYMDNNFDNFGDFGKSAENNHNDFNLEMAQRNQDNSQEHKYPYEKDHDE